MYTTGLYHNGVKYEWGKETQPVLMQSPQRFTLNQEKKSEDTDKEETETNTGSNQTL